MKRNHEEHEEHEAHREWLPILLLLLFVGSGCAALIYEIVWFQILELFIGSSAVSIGVLLGTFMGGMCLGSLICPRLVSAQPHPLRVYAGLELAIGVLGLLLLFVLPMAGRVYASWGGSGASGFVLRGLVAAICLLPPTFAMGATLPAIARWVDRTPTGIAWLGLFYAGNIAGAVFGCLFAGFYLLRIYDMATATFVAAGINGAVAAIGFAMAAVSGFRRTEGSDLAASVASGLSRTGSSEHASMHAGPPLPIIYLVMALSGFCALAGEVIWTRILGLLFGATVYTFSIILAVFLIGLGMGSSLGSLLVRTVARPHVALGWCQLLLVGAIAWSAYILSNALPYWPIVTSVSPDIRYNFQLDLARAIWAILPAPILWGASFPLALASAHLAGSGRDSARLAGSVSAANTIGAVLGALGASLLLVAWIGSQHVQQVMMILSAYAAVMLLMGARVSRLGVIAALAMAAWLVMTVPAIPAVLVAYGKYAVTWVGHTGEVLYVGEGLNSSVAVTRLENGMLNYHNAGKIQASSQPQDMRLQRMLGHATTLAAKHPRTVLVIGCGSGVTAGAVSIDPRVERQTVVEIERLVPQVASTYFGPYNFEVVRNPKVTILIDDARHHLLTSDESFDVITADPFDPWVRGAAALYTKEFFETAKSHLAPGGIMTLWVPLYTTTPEAVKSQVGTFFDVFPSAFMMANTRDGKGYDTVLVGQRDFAPIDLDEISARLQQPDYASVVRSLGEVGFQSATDLFATYAGRAADLKPWLADAALNRDGNLRLQYLAGLGLDVDEPDTIYQQMLRYRRDPEGLFIGSEQTLARLRSGIDASTVTKP